MPLPKHLLIRGDTYYVRRALPLDVQAAFGGRKEVWRSLRTTIRREAEGKAHAVLAAIEADIEAKRVGLAAASEDQAFLSSPRGREAIEGFQRVAGRIPGGPLPTVGDDPADAAWTEIAILSGQVQRAPKSSGNVLAAMDIALAELDADAAGAHLKAVLDHEGEPDFGFPERYREALTDRLRELIEADRRKIEAERAIIAGATQQGGEDAAGANANKSLTALSVLWHSQRKPARSSQADMRTAIARFEKVNGPLAYPAITEEHARRFRDDILGDASLKNATRQKLWGMLRALLNVAVDDALLDSNPFSRVKLRLDDDSAPREVLTQADLEALFGKLTDEEWWIARVGLYTGARLGEICQLTKADMRTEAGVTYLHIREDAEAGKSVKTRSSNRKVPLHRQVLSDGFVEWVEKRKDDALFGITGSVASKRLLRRFRDAGLGEGKVFHSLRHTFKGVARRHMDTEWHDRLTGHAAKSVGNTYGDYDLRTLKAKIDLIEFGIETTGERGGPACGA